MGDLLNLVGLSAGVVLYAVLLAMVLGAGRGRSRPARVDPLLVLTSVLGLAWNLCALAAYELPRMGLGGPIVWVSAVGFGSLGFLPAVVVHSVLRGERDELRGRSSRALAYLAYAVSLCAATWHMTAAASGGAVPSTGAMRLLTYGFVALVLPLALATRGQPGARRALWVAALAVFAVSAFHLGQLHTPQPSWPVELVGHHASLPLALAILYQDYPFAFADLFLKRALALLALVSLALASVALASMWVGLPPPAAQDPRQLAGLVTLWAATALAYPVLRNATAWFVESVVLRRPDYAQLRASIGRRLQDAGDVPVVMAEVCASLAPALSADVITWQELARDDDEAPDDVTVLSGTAAREWVERASAGGGALPPTTAAVVIIPTGERPRLAIAVGSLTGGRRLLSDDFAALEAIAVLVARRIDALRVNDERFERERREQEMGRLATEAELRALRAQINPHFLFNALTTIGYLIQTTPSRALETLMQLTALLRGVLRSDGELTTLGRELDIVQAYLEIERARFEERLRVVIDVPPDLRDVPVPPLVLQALVENAVKHGIAQIQRGGEVAVRASLEPAASGGRHLLLSVRDTGAGASPSAVDRGRDDGVGLRNIERRLHHLFGSAASITLSSVPGEGTVVEVRVPVDARVLERHHSAVVS